MVQSSLRYIVCLGHAMSCKTLDHGHEGFHGSMHPREEVDTFLKGSTVVSVAVSLCCTLFVYGFES